MSPSFLNLPTNPPSELGGIQNDIFFTVMKISHRQAQPTTMATNKVARLSCVCRISELMPLVRQLHDDARAARQVVETLQQAA
ncbi:hypothetical protein Q5H93_21375 [Hymenobacter sp. ASUV-10]|uniref:Uncharacterized protein n=1 Tax=Hymenobacter aranciens TaxID=3063996 RepID=A0ABT9BGB6_9BACT|nr:hypothetical protein [Hymenobacter sp. ASUV-10]MDO7877310.1 hypothetical protein [Hymenobacter sp. ASUV-10]